MQWCKICQQSGLFIELKLFQFNFEDALYMCTQENCHFPMSDNNVEAYIIKRSLEKFLSAPVRKRSHHLRSGLKSKRLKQNSENFDSTNVAELNQINVVTPQIYSGQHRPLNRDLTRLNETVVSSSTSQDSDDNSSGQSTYAQNQASSFNHHDRYDIESSITTSVPGNVDSSFNDVWSHISFDSSDTAVCELSEQNDIISTKDHVDSQSKRLDSMAVNVSPHKTAILPTDKLPHNRSVDLTDDVRSTKTEIQTEDVSLFTTVALSTGSEGEPVVTTTTISKHPEPGCQGDLSSVPRWTKMIQWRNESNLCWLDVILLCIVNNCCLREALNWHQTCTRMRENIFYRLCKTYDDCQAECNEILSKTKKQKKSAALLKSGIMTKLRSIREEMFDLLQTQLSLEKGKDESVVELLPNFLGLDPVVKDMFSVQLRWEFDCEDCGYKQVRRATTTLVTFLSPCNSFHPLDAAFSRPCFSCSAKDQRMNLIMEILPPCLMMHFQEGLPHNRLRTLDFSIQDHLYCVTAVIQYVTSPFHHFIVWIRDNQKNKWMCCDDTKSPICTWKCHAPKIPPKQIHMIMWEKQGLVSRIHFEHLQDIRRKHLTSVTNQEAMLSDDDDFPLEINNENDTIETINLEEIGDSDGPCVGETCVDGRGQVSLKNLHVPLKSSKTDVATNTSKETKSEHDSKTETNIDSNFKSSSDERFESSVSTISEKGSLKSKPLSLPRNTISMHSKREIDSQAISHLKGINLNSTSGVSLTSPTKDAQQSKQRLVIATNTLPSSRSSNKNFTQNPSPNISSTDTPDQPNIVSPSAASEKNARTESTVQLSSVGVVTSSSTPITIKRTFLDTTDLNSQRFNPDESGIKLIKSDGGLLVEDMEFSKTVLATSKSSSILLQNFSDEVNDVPFSNYVRNEYLESQISMLLQTCNELQSSYAALLEEADDSMSVKQP